MLLDFQTMAIFMLTQTDVLLLTKGIEEGTHNAVAVG